MPNRGRAPESPTSVRRLAVRAKAMQALEMRKAGATFEVIAQQLGYSSKADVYNRVMALLEKKKDEAAEPLRRLEVERCDRLQLAVWADAVGGNLKAIETALHIMERRARLLGLDRPVKFEAQIEGILAPVDIHFIVEGQVRELPVPTTTDPMAIDSPGVEVLSGHTHTPNPS